MEFKIRPLFRKFQKELVSYSNTKSGRDFISSFGGNELKENYPVIKITPDGIHQKIGKNLYRAVFYSRSPFIGKFAETLTMADIAWKNNYRVKNDQKQLVIPHFMGDTRLLYQTLPQIYLDSGTYYPDANPESTSVDGFSYKSGTNATWASLHDATDGTSANDSASVETGCQIQAGGTSNGWNIIARAFFLFDTSSLPNDAIASSATFSVYVVSHTDALSQNVDLVASTPASNTAITTADFDQLGTTLQATTVDLTNVTNTAYNDWTLNATGLSNISLTGVTKLGLRMSSDTANSAPTWSNGANAIVGNIDYADNGSNKPKLVVTYSLPIAGGVIII